MTDTRSRISSLPPISTSTSTVTSNPLQLKTPQSLTKHVTDIKIISSENIAKSKKNRLNRNLFNKGNILNFHKFI